MSDKQTDEKQLIEDDQAVSDGSATTDLAFLELEESGTVDLDALFDALNIAAEESGGSMEFVESSDGDAGTLTISGTDLNLGNVASEDLPDATDLLLKSSIVSDES
ncbi:hypothetical protein [Sneathiella sp.]|uniref:hypothetical protein n=1 Tax=Sneathiella sp. TaxID=1964365 RepID=UPI00261D95B9|nr:hypothetical protein [Sneathiella sp.]MDF2366140.1 hypothetical protein [Sneathiella sp.]